MSRTQLRTDYGEEKTEDDPEPLIHSIEREYKSTQGNKGNPPSGVLTSVVDLITHPFVCGVVVAALCGKYIFWAATRV